MEKKSDVVLLGGCSRACFIQCVSMRPILTARVRYNTCSNTVKRSFSVGANVQDDIPRRVDRGGPSRHRASKEGQQLCDGELGARGRCYFILNTIRKCDRYSIGRRSATRGCLSWRNGKDRHREGTASASASSSVIVRQ